MLSSFLCIFVLVTSKLSLINALDNTLYHNVAYWHVIIPTIHLCLFFRLQDEKPDVEIIAKGVGAIGEGGANKWLDMPKASQGSKANLKRSHGTKAEVKEHCKYIFPNM